LLCGAFICSAWRTGSMRFVPGTQQPLFFISLNTGSQFFIQEISFPPG